MNSTALTAAIALNLFSTARTQALEFILLDILPNGLYAYPWAVTPSGMHVAGTSGNGTGVFQAVRWDSLGGIIELGSGTAYAISEDGSVAAGQGADALPVIWRIPETSKETFGDGNEGIIFAVSADGTRGFGYSVVNFWAEGSEFDLMAMTREEIAPAESFVYGATPDGQKLVGQTTTVSGFGATVKAGTLEFEPLPGAGGFPFGFSGAYDISDDGRIVVGRNNNDAVMWVDDDPFDTLGFTFDGSIDHTYVNISGDGRVVVVGNDAADGIVWTQESGPQDLMAVISSAGVDLSEYYRIRPTGISRDGDVLVGVIWEELGEQIPWMIRGFLQTQPPEIRIERIVDGYLIHFRGILQESTTLGDFTDLPGTPETPYFLPAPVSEKRFFRARALATE